MHGGDRGYDLEVPTMIVNVLGTGMSTFTIRLHMLINTYLYLVIRSWSYMIWLVIPVPELLVNDATLPRVTNWLSVDIGEVSRLPALGWELLTALLHTPVLARWSGHVSSVWSGPWFETWRVWLLLCLSTFVSASLGTYAWSLICDLAVEGKGLRCVNYALWGRASDNL